LGLRDGAVGGEVELLEARTQSELRSLDAALGPSLASKVALGLQHRIEEVRATPLRTRGLGDETIKGVEHAEQLHIGHQITGNCGTHSFNVSCCGGAGSLAASVPRL
jgi:hypothetical protein